MDWLFYDVGLWGWVPLTGSGCSGCEGGFCVLCWGLWYPSPFSPSRQFCLLPGTTRLSFPASVPLLFGVSSELFTFPRVGSDPEGFSPFRGPSDLLQTFLNGIGFLIPAAVRRLLSMCSDPLASLFFFSFPISRMLPFFFLFWLFIHLSFRSDIHLLLLLSSSSHLHLLGSPCPRVQVRAPPFCALLQPSISPDWPSKLPLPVRMCRLPLRFPPPRRTRLAFAFAALFTNTAPLWVYSFFMRCAICQNRRWRHPQRLLNFTFFPPWGEYFFLQPFALAPLKPVVVWPK